MARKYVFNSSFYDRQEAETINMITPTMILEHLGSQFPDDPIHVYVANIEKGEVLLDQRGRGSFQTVEVQKG